jgi:hypothetical protein
MRTSSFIQPILAFIVLTFISCAGGSNPESSAEKFLNAFNDRNFDEARKYSTEETGKLIDLMENLTRMAPSDEKPPAGKIEIISHVTEGETATVLFRENDTREEQELKLKKVDGKWLVHVTKEDIATKDAHLGTGEDEDGYWSDDYDEDSTGTPEPAE